MQITTGAAVDTTLPHVGSLRATLDDTPKGRYAMPSLLVPVDGSTNSLCAVRHVIGGYSTRPDLLVHLLNVQRPLSSYVGRFVRAAECRAFLKDRAQLALQPAQALLDEARVPYRTQIEIGDKARVIVELAGRLRCTAIVMGTARRNSMLRWIENSTTNRVIELTRVPVLIVAGSDVTRAERYGVPAVLGTALAALLYAAAT